MRKYLRILRVDHWIKQLFIFPGCVFATFLTKWGVDAVFTLSAQRIVTGFLAACLIASANYAINEYLDAEFDRFHPTKKYRPAVAEGVRGSAVFALWAALTVAGLFLASLLGRAFLFTAAWLWGMGIVYNVKPFRTKDIPVVDVLSESVNNAIRLLMGWFLVSWNTLPPCSIILGYWMGGAFLMATKRFAEYRMIGDPVLAGSYRRSFRFYTEKSLLISAFVYAMISVFFTGIFLIKYRIEYVLFVPTLIGLFAYYFWLAFQEDSAAQKPEKLYHEKGLMLYCAVLIAWIAILTVADIPALSFLISEQLIRIG